jgi:Zn finger protein HypA/HybF involved in hydrogenase expression
VLRNRLRNTNWDSATIMFDRLRRCGFQCQSKETTRNGAALDFAAENEEPRCEDCRVEVKFSVADPEPQNTD